jgi:hypothetical protein
MERKGLMRVFLAIGVSLAVMPFVAGCGGGGGSGTPSAQPPTGTSAKTQQTGTPSATSQRGFLATASNGALFIQWTRTANTVRGTLSEAYTSLADPTHAQSESHSFTGVISGSSVTLTLDSGTNWNGTLNGSNVTLSYANSDGSLQTFDFHPGSVAEYNAAVANVQGSAGQAQTHKAQAQAAVAARARSVAQDQQNRQILDGDVSQVQTDLGDLTSAVSTAKSDVGTIASDVGTMRSDVQTTYSDLQTLLSDSKDSVCGDAGTVEADASGTVGADLSGTLGADRDGTLAADLQQVTSALGSLRSDFEKYRSDQAVVTNYTPSRAPTQAQINSAITSEQTSVTNIHTSVAGYFATANKLLIQANGYASQAQAACTKAGG